MRVSRKILIFFEMFRFNIKKYILQNKKPVSKGYDHKAGFVFILGMHRSGTSCLAGSLERCGIFLGEVVRQGSEHNDNAKGSHELKMAMRIHDGILAANGGSWHQPPASITINTHQKKTLKRIVDQLTKNRPCGIKDPRLLLLLHIWTNIVDSYVMVGTFRHPTATVKSLVTRNQMPENVAYNLWLRYNTELVRWHTRYHFPIIEFDLSQANIYRETIVSLAASLGLRPNLSRLHEFITPNLEHHCSIGEPVPTSCQKTYEYLKQHCYQTLSENNITEG